MILDVKPPRKNILMTINLVYCSILFDFRRLQKYQLLMLTITKKTDLKASSTPSHYQSEQEQQTKIRSHLTQEKDFSLLQILRLYESSSSINAQTLAQLMHVIAGHFTFQNYDEGIDTLLKLYGLSHDEDQFRYSLKNKWKIDPILFLHVLYERREHPLATRLASTIVDIYTLTLMLDGKFVVKLWKDHILSLRFKLEHFESILQHFKRNVLSKKESKEKKEEVSQGFRQISIPL